MVNDYGQLLQLLQLLLLSTQGRPSPAASIPSSLLASYLVRCPPSASTYRPTRWGGRLAGALAAAAYIPMGMTRPWRVTRMHAQLST